jgi:N-6 DNA Methylase
MAKLDPEVLAHLEWLGFVQPTGLVFSAPALVRAGAILDRRDADGQRLLRECVEERELETGDEPQPVIADFKAFAESVLGWTFSPKGYAGMNGEPIPPELEVALPEYGETLRPDFAVRERDPLDGTAPWQVLVRVLDVGEDFDRDVRAGGKLEASARGRMERLLRETGVPAGLLVNGRAIRLISAPRGESSGWLDFKVSEMTQTAGRAISTALRLLLSEQRLLTLPREQRLAALLDASRRFQNEVSEKLAVQVLHALYELLRGLQAAQDASGGELLREQLAEHPDEVYRALLTVILRLVFLLYAEEREMLPSSETFLRSYSLAGLFERLLADNARYPDTMNQRYGAWAQLLALFRMVNDGADAGGATMPPRHGALFDPDRFPFLEGRSSVGVRQVHERVEPPLVPDGTIYRALDKLLVLDGERISYRALDVEQIGSVYETMMGFSLEVATGRSLAVKAQSRYGAPTTVDLDALLDLEPEKRGKWLKDRADRKVTPKVGAAVKDASSLEGLHAALTPVIDIAATPDLVGAGAMILQPSEERRRSGSHYTPRELTEPIVRATLEPILDGLRGNEGQSPEPAQILDVKVCDPAMGSGAFLVEACRQLGDALIEAWNAHGQLPEIPYDEDEVTFARRTIARRCLYGVDRNPVAVDLAKMSLWLMTLAREHALTFVDHALRHGDSLLGVSRRQLESFNWKPSVQGLEATRIGEVVERVTTLRREIMEAGEEVSDWALQDIWDEAQAELDNVRLFGDLLVAAFFTASAAHREEKRLEFLHSVSSGEAERYRPLLEDMRQADRPLVPFHWEIEFPEVFERPNPGFDAYVGNPPFLGGTRISELLGMSYFQRLATSFHSCGHHCDLVAYFFRRVYAQLRRGGCAGLIATNTVAQGDTREGGLRVILAEGGQIYRATRRLRWPGLAAVIVSVVHVSKDHPLATTLLDDRPVSRISAYLVNGTVDDSPPRLTQNPYFSLGSKIYGQGFLFADEDPQSTPIAVRTRLLEEHPDWAGRMPPYLMGEEINSDPHQSPRRFAISLSDVSDEAALGRWPELRAIVEQKVKPERLRLGDNPNNIPLKRRWWAYQAHRPELYARIANRRRVLCLSAVGQALAFAFLPVTYIFSQTAVVIDLDQDEGFAVLQSRVHEIWVRFLASSLEDRLRYTPSDCFETFPFPGDWLGNFGLQAVGETYYDFRAALMARNDEGLTKTYNRFHDPHEHSDAIERLRTLHARMDRAVLDAYGWDDITADCEFLLEYEIDEEAWGKKKKPFRYRWPDETQDEVLARLIELNGERADDEQLAGAASGKGRTGPTSPPVRTTQPEGLF